MEVMIDTDAMVQAPERFDPAALLTLCHQMADGFGYTKIRVDEGVSLQGWHYVAGYGCGTVRVRFPGSQVPDPVWEVTRENYRPAAVRQLAQILREHA